MNIRRALLLVPALFALLWPVPAQAADEIGLSPDGVAWTSELDVPLFEPERRWVPGDEETRTFQVRNQGPSAAAMTVEASSPSGDAVLAADMAVSVRVDGGAWTLLDLDSAPGHVTVAPVSVDGAVPVDVRAVFDPASGNPTQNRTMPLTLRITLVGDVSSADDAGGSGGGGAGGSAGDGSAAPGRGEALPGTGATLSGQVLLAALALCAAGALLIARRPSDDAVQNGATP